MKDQNKENVAINNSDEGRGISAFAATNTIERHGVTLRPANHCVVAGASQSDPADLYDGLWYEGELCALYADTNLGKSILAVQIAETVAAKGFKVMYVDLELSDKGFELRARQDEGKGHHVFPANLYRCTIDFRHVIEDNGGIDDNGFDIIDRIEAMAIAEGVEVVIVDNITALCSGMESGDVAVRLVNRLLQMRGDSKMSVMFVAHTPKLDRTQPITRDSMAGSKRIVSLIDSAFAIGQSLSDPSLRYIKQTKVRVSECKYHDNNVKVCRIEKVDGLLQFVTVGYATESKMLQTARKSVADDVIRDARAGMNRVEIAKKYGLTYDQIRYMQKKHDIASGQSTQSTDSDSDGTQSLPF